MAVKIQYLFSNFSEHFTCIDRGLQQWVGIFIAK